MKNDKKSKEDLKKVFTELLQDKSFVELLRNAVTEKNTELDLKWLEEEVFPLEEEKEEDKEEDDCTVAINLVEKILEKIIAKKAQSAHIQPTSEKLLVRYKIDGMLYDGETLPLRLQNVLVARLKILAGVDISEKRLAQDGYYSWKQKEKVNFCINFAPTYHGERVRISACQRKTKPKNLDELGLSLENKQLLQQLVQKKSGIVVFAGPTGCGKTTALYALLSEINPLQKNIITVEYPIEYIVENISQMQVNPRIGLSLSNLLRAALKQDPDVVVTKIMDVESAMIAVDMALSGRLVLASMHTNDATSTIFRFLHMGIEPSLLASSLLATVGIRLARRICKHCSQPYQPAAGELKALKLKTSQLQKGTGCDQCFASGYFGQIALHDALFVNESLQKKIRNNHLGTLEQEAKKQVKTFRADGAQKVSQGLTTIEEVLRVL